MINKGIGATTHVDRHNCRITKEALEKAAFDIKNSGSVPQIGLNHDKTIMPLGKIIDANVTLRNDGEYQLEIFEDVFDEEYTYKYKNGMKLIENRSSIDTRPFTEEFDDYQLTSVNVDRVNFEKEEDFNKFIEEINQYDNIEHAIIARKSLIPDPELVIKVGQSITGILLCKRVYDSIGDRVLDKLLSEIDKFYDMVRNLIVKYSQLAIPKNRPQTYVFNLKDDFTIELIIVTNKPNEVMTAIEKDKLILINKKVEDLKSHFSIKRIQFI